MEYVRKQGAHFRTIKKKKKKTKQRKPRFLVIPMQENNVKTAIESYFKP